jgi:adenylate kinase
MSIILMFGPPGSGKGTQSKRLKEELNFDHISFGDVLRDHIEKNTVIGQKVNKIVEKGNLVSFEIVEEILEQEIDKILKNKKTVIFDGFPRNLEQAILFEKKIKEKKISIKKIFFLDIDEKTIEERLISRSKVENRIDDQDLKKIKHRIQVYQKETIPLIDFFKNHENFFKIDGLKKKEEVFDILKLKLTEKI